MKYDHFANFAMEEQEDITKQVRAAVLGLDENIANVVVISVATERLASLPRL